jgi:superfamily II DNA or RNA helicase
MRDAFLSEGVSAEIITSGNEDIGVTNQTTNERNRIFKKFRNGEIEVLISVMALCEGFDEPLVKYCFLCRRLSNNNIPLYHQIVGRGTRIGTDGFYVVDLFDNFERFGPVEEYDWNEYESEIDHIFVKSGNVISHEKFQRTEKVYLRCEECNHVYDMKAHLTCTHCNKINNVKLNADVSELKSIALGLLSNKTKANLIAQYKTEVGAFKFFAETAQKALMLKKCDYFNRTYANIFDNNGNIIYPWLLKIMKNTKMDEKISWEN